MIIDRENAYSNAQALTGSAASTDLIDHKSDRDLGIGEPMALVIVSRVKADETTGDETYAAQLQTDDNSGFGSPTSIGPSITMARTDPAGTKYVIYLPPDTNLERYTRVNYTLGGTTPTITVDAWLTSWRAIQNDRYYADAITIS